MENALGSNRLIRRVEVRPALAALFLLLLLSPLIFQLQITHDAAWQMWIGRQMLYGANLYTDIVEVNPPLWFWLAMPIEAFARAVRANSIDTLIGLFLAVIAGVIILVNRLLREAPERQRVHFLVALVIAAVPFGNFGQREHFAFIVTVPYVLLVARRAAGQPTSASLAGLIGIVAATGFALKPHFAVVPIVLELWLRRSPIRPETIALAVAAILYGLCIFLFERDYFTEAVPLAGRAYGQFGGFHPLMLVPTALPLLLAALIPLSRRSASTALLVAALAYYLVFAVQLKGFAYHAIPAMGFLALALVAAIPGLSKVQTIGALAIALFAIAPNARPYRTAAWANIPSGSSYAALSVAPRAGWPLVEERKLTWPLRSISLWMAPALGSEIREFVVHDLRCNTPAYLLVDDSRYAFSELFADVIAHYTPIERNGRLVLMKMSRPLPAAGNCRKVHSATE